MTISTYTPKRPEYQVAKYYGVDSMHDICELAGTDEFTITQERGGRAIAQIAGLTLKHQDILMKAPDGTLTIMSVSELNERFEVLK